MRILVFVLFSSLATPAFAEGFKTQLSESILRCWNTGALSSNALRVTIEIEIDLDEGGHVKPGSISMVTASHGEEGAIRQAFEAARRAVLRCSTGGYQERGSKRLQFGPEGVVETSNSGVVQET